MRTNRTPRSFKNKLSLIILTVILASTIVGIRYIPKMIQNKDEVTSTEEAQLEFKDSLLNAIFELRLEHPYIVYSQAIIESGNFTSNIWKENNNMFGMKVPERRATLAIGISKGHAVYRNWRDCLVDYALYQSAYLRGLSEDEYFSKIGRSYAEDGSYEKKIREAKNQHKISIK